MNSIYNLIKKYEGFRDTAYKCPSGILTIGYGNTYYQDHSKIKEYDKINKQDAEDLLIWYCNHEIKLPNMYFNENQKKALYSLIYNVGQTCFDKSKLKQAIVNNDNVKIYKEWDFGIYDKHLGILRRRSEELYWFFK